MGVGVGVKKREREIIFYNSTGNCTQSLIPAS